MEKDDIYYKAMLSRDPRFDGKFFIGVKTTGIYCRPICLARPKRENVEFFTELRRFNDAFKRRYHLPPSFIRKTATAPAVDNTFRLHIAYRPPLDWESLLLYYAKHQIHFVEEVSKIEYKRIYKIGSSIGLFSLQNDSARSQVILKVHTQDPKDLFIVANRVRKMFDLNSDPFLIHNQFSRFPFLADLWKEFPGLRIARGWDPYEIAIGTILGQVVSVKQASKLMGDLVQHYGEKIIHPIEI